MALVALTIVASLVWFWGRQTDSHDFYAFLERHAAARQLVRPFFVLTGKQNEFDLGIARAHIGRLLAELVLQEALKQAASEE